MVRSLRWRVREIRTRKILRAKVVEVKQVSRLLL
jgi:hypothetical protein